MDKDSKGRASRVILLVQEPMEGVAALLSTVIFLQFKDRELYCQIEVSHDSKNPGGMGWTRRSFLFERTYQIAHIFYHHVRRSGCIMAAGRAFAHIPEDTVPHLNPPHP